jgi:hypothetical protein
MYNNAQQASEAHSFVHSTHRKVYLIKELSFIFFMMIIGMFLFHYIEGWTYFDSIYFIVVTLTSVGFGDIVPVTETGRVLGMLYAIMGVPLFIYTTSIFLEMRFRHYIKKYKHSDPQEHQPSGFLDSIAFFTLSRGN